ncbi:hypothetical protein DICPUDRAFT_160079 [Dictyostelium purpureum]|uniref:F5/8 type C domain-containing protein n=1 Tax=Dictyostelium purpureum TaxID=5786 RepID=F1A5N6_DICPU|nr:uncharacterized protein DICPUDRAFT_160079 [Dictyostelium purpureum]EGC28494.1 hypothetical protein DICPUDRAFT_160079 [Dictyostelium purpureum]|eukprot:XP_003294980.1 hypothetical protein DICPUDRAFT_160079 [Dictyostelium purpureum]
MSQSLTGLVHLLANAQCHLRTSTNWDGNHTQANAVLNYQNSKDARFDGSEAWCASVNDTNQFIIAGCEVPRTFVALSIQGRGDADQWVTSYKIRYSLDNVTWVDYRNGAAIQGSTDRNTVTTHFFDTPLRARSVAIHPLTWSGHVSLRFELYTQPTLSTFTQIGHVDSGANGVLNSGTGAREIVVPVTFPVTFSKVPEIALTFDLIDSTADESNQVRVEVEARNVTAKSFECVFKTWWHSKVYSLRGDWTASINE